MAKDVGDAIGTAIGHAAREVASTVSSNAHKASKKQPSLSGGKGVAAGAGLVALVPLAAKGAGMVVKSVTNGTKPLQLAGDKLTSSVSDAVGKQVEQAGGASGLAKEAGKAMLPFGGGGGKSTGVDGVGKGRRMPIQQSVDVAAPISEVYNGFTQFEDWPKFMHRLQSAAQEDETHVKFKVKIWGKSKEWTAEILVQIPDEKIKWRVSEGMSHTGVVTFHELAPRLTRIEANVDIHPGSLIEKMGRGMRHAKRAVRADLHRFKAHMEIDDDFGQEGWRGEIQDGDVTSKASDSSGSSSRRSSGSSSGRSSGASSGRSSSRRSSGGSNGSNGSGSSRSASASRSRSSRASSSNGSGSSRSSGSSGSSKSSGRSGSSRSSGASGSSKSSGRSGGTRTTSRKKSTSKS
jgi:uncharacterized membrane protein